MGQLQPGAVLGKYQIEDRLGQGAMSVVYKAYQPGVARHVAIKALLGHLASQHGFVERFKREARAVARLQHRNIIALYDFDEQDGVAYIVMEFVSGKSLGQLIRGPMEAEHAVRYVSQLADALEYAHHQGVIHRDVKPGNIMIEDETDRVVLMDFGFSKIVEESLQLTRPGTNLGTPHFMSPEQVLGKAVDSRTDVYAMGVVLYQLVTGKLPYSGENAVAVLRKVLQEPMPRPSAEVPSLPLAVEQVVLTATAKNREDRYPSAGAMKTALEAAISDSGRAVSTAPTSEAAPAAPVSTRPATASPSAPRMGTPPAPVPSSGTAASSPVGAGATRTPVPPQPVAPPVVISTPSRPDPTRPARDAQPVAGDGAVRGGISANLIAAGIVLLVVIAVLLFVLLRRP